MRKVYAAAGVLLLVGALLCLTVSEVVGGLIVFAVAFGLPVIEALAWLGRMKPAGPPKADTEDQ